MKKPIVAGFIVALSQLVYLTSASAYPPWYYGAAYGAGMGGYSAQTPYSAGANSMANVIRSQGMYNEYSSRAAVNYQQAQKQYIENQEKAFAARQTAKRMAHAETLRSNEEARAQQARADEFMATHRPPPLSTSQLDASSGKLNWPITLRLPDFDAQRKVLDELFEKRAKYGSASDVSTLIEVKTGELKDSLRSHITKVPLPEYSESRQFLDSMVSTVR